MTQVYCLGYSWLQICSKSFDFIDDVVHVRFVQGRVLQDQSEEVGLIVDRLVCDHHRTFPHHAFLDLGGNLVEPFGELCAVTWYVPQSRWHVPEAHVGTLGILDDHFKTFSRLNTAGEVLRILEHLVDVLFQSGSALGTPHEPKFEHVGTAATLDVLIAGVVLGVVEFVLLEEIGRVGRVALR